MNGDLIHNSLQLANAWTIIGLFGALLFSTRWFVQFFHAKKTGRAEVPTLFWLMSSIGSISTLLYFIFGNLDLIGIISNFFPLLISLYNLYLITRRKDGGD